jgi:LysR family transcriptional activator of nhaA
VPHPIAEQPVALVGPKGRARRREDLAAILRREPVLLPTVESSIRAGFDALCERLGVHPRIAAEVDDMAMLRLLAGARLGLAVVPPIVVQDELAAGALVQVAELPLVETFYAVTRRRRFPNPVLAELLRARARP